MTCPRAFRTDITGGTDIEGRSTTAGEEKHAEMVAITYEFGLNGGKFVTEMWKGREFVGTSGWWEE